VVLAGLAQWERGKAAAQEATAAPTGLARARLERRLLFLGTVGNNAPFVGLLGTVIGVLGAFDALGQTDLASGTSALGPERVMGAIAESLVATAVGLMVAIPSVLVFNYFQALSTAAVANAETLGHVLLTITGINVTPLVDIILVLLIVFMVTAKLIVRQHAVPLDLPKAASGQDVQEVFSVSLTTQGATYLNGTPIADDDALLAPARAAHAKNKELRVVVQADGAVAHRRVMHVLDVLKRASVARIGFGVVPEVVPPVVEGARP
jgi:biopolymer transport protein ExbD